jgi:hypothetical protein
MRNQAMQAYTFPTDETTAADWQAALDYANDQERYPGRDPRTPCSNPDCSALTEALYCSEVCRLALEGIDDADYYQDGAGCLLGNREIADAQRAADGESLASLVCGYGPVPAAPAAPAAPALGEAPCSVNVHVPLHGRDVLVTLRGMDEGEVLTRLEAVLAQYPVAQPPTAPEQAHGEGFCHIHGTQMRFNPGKNGRPGWFSHKGPNDEWCKGKARRP